MSNKIIKDSELKYIALPVMPSTCNFEIEMDAS